MVLPEALAVSVGGCAGPRRDGRHPLLEIAAGVGLEVLDEFAFLLGVVDAHGLYRGFGRAPNARAGQIQRRVFSL